MERGGGGARAEAEAKRGAEAAEARTEADGRTEAEARRGRGSSLRAGGWGGRYWYCRAGWGSPRPRLLKIELVCDRSPLKRKTGIGRAKGLHPFTALSLALLYM